MELRLKSIVMSFFRLFGNFILVSSFCFTTLAQNQPFFINDIVSVEKENFLTVSKGNKQAVIYSSNFSSPLATLNLSYIPTGVAVYDNQWAITTFDNGIGRLLLGTVTPFAKTEEIIIGSGATSPQFSQNGKKIYICLQFQHEVAEFDMIQKKITKKVSVLREPKGCVTSLDGNHLFVTNFLPVQISTANHVAAAVSVIDLRTFKKIKDIDFANGSNALRGITITNDGKYVLVPHNLGRFQVPTSQLQQGWMNTSALSVIEVSTLNYLGAIILDEPQRGAAGSWDVKTTADIIVVSHSGTHDVSIIDYKKMIEKLKNYKAGAEALSYDLQFLYGIRQRVDVYGNAPRVIEINNNQVIVPTYFSDTVNIINLENRKVNFVAINKNRTETVIQKGEKIFNDASFCFQQWQSCNGCHPGDARTDGMNWDLMNDGIGNPKNCKSLLFSHVTPPSMISGIRVSAELAVRKGFQHIQFYDIDEERAAAVDEYLKSLRPVPSPYLVDGKLSKNAEKGRKVFEQQKCNECHSGPYYTDLKMYRIGEDIEFEKGWDTPTLIEVWRTAPYLFDGRAATLQDVFQVHKHGITQPISKEEIKQLVEYVNSL